MNLTPKWLSSRRRRALYVATAGALAVAGVYGYVNDNEAAAWLGLVAAVLGIAQDNVED